MPPVTIQLPLYNEMYVAERLIEAVCKLDYPKEKLEIQVLDDSTDETVEIVAKKISFLKTEGMDIVHIRRHSREGYKAGALAYGLKQSKGDFVAIFDADFLPPSDFLKRTLPVFSDDKVGMVQTRWGHVNANYSLFTRLQALFLDGHFLLEHTARYKSGAFFNFNGTAGIWRKKTIEDAGGWSARTLTEDLDLSYRAQLAGWKFVYLPDFVCPAELPVDIHSFRSQQRRWTKGAIQVSRHLLPDIWKANIPFHTKFESTLHLTANIGYLLTVFVAVMLLPSLLFRHHWFGMGLSILEVLAFASTTLSIGFFYAVAQKELHLDWRWRLKDIPVLMSFGIGMCVNNAAAVLEGLREHESEFVRTPKFNITTRADGGIKRNYLKRSPLSWGIQGLFAGYAGLTFLIAIYIGDWVALPFIALFVGGFSYVAGLSYLHR
jgi:cellulose synthase/poly-beta-1,6-N-acetylglucosamine synthase-like glycosyltransferase